jgi:hypothetical protein
MYLSLSVTNEICRVVCVCDGYLIMIRKSGDGIDRGSVLVLFQYVPGRTEENHQEFHNVRCRGRDLNSASPGYEFHASAPEPPCSGLDTYLFDTNNDSRVMWPQILFVSLLRQRESSA